MDSDTFSQRRALNRAALVALAASASSLPHALARAQSYPSRPIRIIVPATPGGAPDQSARMIANQLTQSLGQSVLVENRTGADGIIGADLVAKSAPDGYTLVHVAINHAVNPSVFKTLPFDTIRDFAPVAQSYIVPFMLVVHPSLPVKTLKELVAHSKSNPKKLSFASSGTGSRISMEYFNSVAGLDMVHVPYRGSTASHPDMLSGRIDLMFDSVPALDPHVKSGKLRALAVTTDKRSSLYPDVPTVAELGYAGFNTSTWGGVLAPAGTPADVVNRLNAEIGKALAAPDVRQRMMQIGMESIGGTPRQFSDFIAAEIEKWAKLVKIAKIEPQ